MSQVKKSSKAEQHFSPIKPENKNLEEVRSEARGNRTNLGEMRSIVANRV